MANQLALPEDHRTYLAVRETYLQQASMFYAKKKNTQQIARALKLPEAVIWKRMDLAREIWRSENRQSDQPTLRELLG